MSHRRLHAAAMQLLWALSCVCILLAGRVHAQMEPVIALAVEPEIMPSQALAASLQAELGVGVSALEHLQDTIPTIRVVRLENGNVEVSLASRSLPRASRELVLEGTPEEQTETLTLIAANLVRNEAAALLPDLRPAPVVAAPVPVVPPPPAPVLESPCHIQGRRTFGADVAPMVGTSSIPEGRAATRAFSIGLLGTYSARLQGVELSVGVNIKRLSVCGVQIAVGANVALGPVSGVQISEFNFARGPLVGAQFAIGSLAGASVRGAQFGVVSAAFGKVTGAQLGVLSVAGGGVHGFQAGVVNVDLGHSEGFQGGVANFARNVDGFQGGVVNLNVGALHGTQLGSVNVTTGEVHGVQLGVLNYADKSNASIGVLSIVRHGRTSIDGAFSVESMMNMVGITHGGKYIHNVLGVGTRRGEHGTGSRLAVMYGLGVRVLSMGRFRVDLDALAVQLKRKDAYRLNTVVPTVRVPVTINVWRNLGVTVTPSYQIMITDDPEENTNSLWGEDTFKDGDRRVYGYPGLAIGARWEFDHGL